MEREDFITQIKQGFEVHPIVAILGPRQCGKTTIARMYTNKIEKPAEQNYFDLEDPNDIARLQTAKTTLLSLKGLIIIDEIQRQPELFQILRVLVDQPQNQQRFLILGSASRELLKQSSETLAGRIFYIELTPFSYPETKDMQKLWERGGFPPSFLANNDSQSALWRKSYIKTFLEQDIPNLGIKIPPQQLRRFWMMLAHYHGNIFNSSEIGRSLSLSHNTIRNYLDILTSTLMIRPLQPWFENISKRQVKSPKIYFRDTGIFHTLLDIENKPSLLTHPKLGSSWEGFAMEEIIRYHKLDQYDCYFWATHTQAELDLLIAKGNKKIGFEFKYTDSPKITKSMAIAIEDLKLEKLVLIYPGTKTFALSDKIKAIPLQEYLSKE